MPKHTTLNALFTAIANAIRSKTGGSAKIVADNFPSLIESISTGINPTGTKTITANGEHDVTSFAKANVNVPVGVFPSGAKTITENGTHDVTNYASANVNVPIPSGYIKPSGTKTITENGTFDVTSFASAAVNVASSPASENVVVRTVTLSADVTNTNWQGQTIISADSFIKAHYSDSRFFAILATGSPIATGTGVVHWIYHGNRNIGATSPAWYAMAILGTSASALGFATQTTKINGEGYNISLRVDSSGNLKVYAASNRIVKAGTYKIVLGLIDY